MSAVYFSSSAFWITIDRPNVATIANAGSTPTTRSNTSRCRITPTTNAPGSTMKSVASGLMSSVVDVDKAT